VIEHAGRGILLDVEGTTSSVSFVYDVMFPFVRRELDRFLAERWGGADLTSALDRLAQDADAASLVTWCSGLSPDECRARVRDEVHRLMDSDAKTTGLKQLQGLIWQAGFESGELKAHVYDDVPSALHAWNEQGRDVRVYSSGSVLAQRLFFGHTTHGNLLDRFSGHYDTTIGPKKESASYSRIAENWGVAPGEILFVSDVVDELDAAHAAGMQTALCLRPGNAPVAPGHAHPTIHSLAEIALRQSP
jgi:enolase-phosphatase E1